MKHDWVTWNGEDDGEVDAFAGTDYGYHNGPLCKRCGFTACEHCHPEIYEQECTKERSQ